ncbi:MAG: alpha/beta hydrolase [Thermoleophilaceae bacterium]|nr:alpha/beta hydrolase [Thermoleophilaceae bacterium]
MTTFALVHGAWHGRWCWERLAPELEDLGHHVISMDLPSDDPAATFDAYADVVAGQMQADGQDEFVVVGHSLAGLTIPLVAARQEVARLVYLCALVPVPGGSFMDQLTTEQDMIDLGYLAGLGEPDAEGRRGWVDEGLARHFMYADCDDQAAEAAIGRLRPQAQSPYAVPCRLDAFPDTPCTYVVCGEDRLVNPDWSRRVARERLNADLVELPGSHSPFLSRPSELARVLHEAQL